MLKKAYILILLSVILVGCSNTQENTDKEESNNTQENAKKGESKSTQESTDKEESSNTQKFIENKKIKEVTNFDGNSKVIVNNDYKRIILWKDNDNEKYKSILLKKKNTLKIIDEKKDEQIYYGDIN